MMAKDKQLGGEPPSEFRGIITRVPHFDVPQYDGRDFAQEGV
jgi:hypothetical protein